MTNKFEIGTKVSHHLDGKGVIINAGYDNKNFVQVDFDGYIVWCGVTNLKVIEE